MMRFVCLLLLLFSSWAQALVGNCPSNFPDGLQSPYDGNANSKGVIRFDFNAQLLGNPNSVLEARTVNRNVGSTLLTCSSANCTASGIAAPFQDAGSFPTTSTYTATVNVPFASSQTLAGNGVNQYRSITLNDSAQLTINGSAQSFFIDQLNLASSSILRLSPGDYWVRALSTGFQSQIQVQGSGQVRLFVRDNWTLASSALLNSPAINSAGNANNLYLFSYGSVTLNNQATLSGYVYSAFSQGANQAITLDSPSYVFGALSGENIALSTNARVSYVAPSGSCGGSLLSWRMNESAWTGAAGQVLDSSGNGLNGQAFNNATTNLATPALVADSNGFGTCRYGEFSSANRRYLQIADNSLLDLDGSFTVGLWVRPLSRATLMTMVSKDENYEFHINANGFVNWWWQTSTATQEFNSTTTVPLNAWTHVAIRFSPGAQRIFINGLAAGSASFSGTPRTNTDPFQVGSDQGSAGRYFNGALDELRVYNRALSDAEMLALTQERPALCATAPDHYELVYASNQALTCNPLNVTLRACQNSSCSSLYASPVTTNLSPSGAPNNWSVTPLTFTGSAAVQFQRTTAGVATLGLTATPLASNATQCIVGGVPGSCAVSFAESGFIFDVPDMLAAKPTAATLRAVKFDDASQSCVPGFSSGSRTVQFSRTYTNPASGTLPVLVNGSTVTASSDVTLNFDANASAPLSVQYADAGLITLDARYAPTSGLENGLVMTGSDTFVSRPYGLLLESDTSSSCTAADISCPVYPGARAGDTFSLKIKAVGWQFDGEALTAAALADNLVTPNFQLSDIALSSQLLAPAGGSAGTLGANSYNHVLGNQTSVAQSISEVGVFSITATPTTSYFGTTVSGGTSGNVGRFIPRYLSTSGSASLTPACGSAFSYQGQQMAFAVAQQPQLTVTGRNAQGGVTGNYDRGLFWRLNTPGRDAYLSVTGKASLDAAGRLMATGTSSVIESGADSDDGARTFSWSGETLSYTPASLPIVDDLPFTAAVRQGFPPASLTDADGACYLNGLASCQSFSFDFTNSPGTQVRLGRLRLDNAHGSELQPLVLPLWLESWQSVGTSSAFRVEPADTCSGPLLGAATLASFTGNLQAGDTAATLTTPLAGSGNIRLSAPGAGKDGGVTVSLPALTWLWFDWNGTGRSPASALASFGVFQGSQPLIFRREQYRSQ